MTHFYPLNREKTHIYNTIIEVETDLPEKSNIIHDILAHLAEQMIKMNKKKNEETKGFPKRLDRIEIFILFNQVIRSRVYKSPLEKGAKGVV